MDTILITDVGSVDIDDVFTVLLYASFCKNDPSHQHKIICTHHFATKRTDIVQLILKELGVENIKVYTSDYNQTQEQFYQQNPLFPTKIFGDPFYNGYPGGKPWFPNFGTAYDQLLNDQPYVPHEKENAYDMLVRELAAHSPLNKIKVICVAPPFDLQDIPSELYKNMELWMMGGGFHNEDSFETYQAGYNWGICPNATQKVLESSTLTSVITSSIIRFKQCEIKMHTYEKWMYLSKQPDCAPITKAIMQDWLNCNRGNALTSHKNTADPITLLLALDHQHFGCHFENLFCEISNEDKYEHYMEKIPGFPLINVSPFGVHNVRFVRDLDSELANSYITDLLDDILFPLDGDKFCRALINNFTFESLPNNNKILQVVGNCKLYTRKHTHLITEFLKQLMQVYYESGFVPVVEYGLTGFSDLYDKNYQARYDINMIVEKVCEELGVETIANTVTIHTCQAIKEWGARFSKTAKLFTVVPGYFGDDIDVTDNICDELVCFDGGVQSFAQCINCLTLNKHVIVVGGFPRTGYFSCAEFMEILGRCTTEDECYDAYDLYFSLVGLVNKKQNDATTKHALFQKAWNKYVKNRLWEKFPNFVTLHLI